MTTIKLKISDKALDKVLWLLSHFRSDEVQVVSDKSFEDTKKHLHEQYSKLKSGESTLVSLEEASKKLDEVIARYDR